ncbi:MAG: TetR/AcrR family transcriptional regulator [Acidobacteriota bacterium]
MSALIVDKKKKKQEIVLAALEVFAVKGFSRTTIRDIAEQAGIGKGTIYEYFTDKDEIIHNSFFYFQNFYEFDIEDILLSDRNGKEKLVSVIKSITKILRGEDCKYLDLMFDFWAEGIKGHSKSIMLNEMNRFYKSYRNLFEDILIEGIGDGSLRSDLDPDAFASIIIGMLDGIMVQWILDKEGFEKLKIEESLIKLVLEGAGRINKGMEDNT